MKQMLKHNIKIALSALFLISPLNAVESLLEGLKKAEPLAKRTLEILKPQAQEMLFGLEKAVPKAQLMLNNCVTKLPPENKIKGYAKDISYGVLLLNKAINDAPIEARSCLILSFPGCDIDRMMRQALDEMRVQTFKDPQLKDLPAYKNSEEICKDLYLEEFPLSHEG